MSIDKKTSPRIIVALDYSSLDDARQLINKLNPKLCRLKVGKIMFTRYGPDFVRELINKGFDVFLDLKFHDIPQTVAGACLAAAELGVWMMNVHVQGGQAMLRAASEILKQLPDEKRPLLIGVTVLTSLEESDLKNIGINENLEDVVTRYATIAKDSGLDGVVCSAKEAVILRKKLGKEFLLVTPGIRLATDDKQDQKRILTPKAAVSAGADYLVIGRSITQADDPVSLLHRIQKDIND